MIYELQSGTLLQHQQSYQNVPNLGQALVSRTLKIAEDLRGEKSMALLQISPPLQRIKGDQERGDIGSE